MSRWGSELTRLGDGRVVDATIPSKTDASALRELQDRIGSLPLPAWEVTGAWRDALLLPAACGPKLFARLESGAAPTSGTSANDMEIAALLCLRDFRRVMGLRFSNSASSDVLKVASCFGINAYRKKVACIRNHMVTVDEIGGVASYIPPPPKYVHALLEDLYKTISHQGGEVKSVIALGFYAMCHFIAIHPLSDGNGRSGRALFLRIASKGGIPAHLSSLIVALLHTKYLYPFHSSLMKYCISGSISALADVIFHLIHELPAIVPRQLSNRSDSALTMFDYSLNVGDIKHLRKMCSDLYELVA